MPRGFVALLLGYKGMKSLKRVLVLVLSLAVFIWAFSMGHGPNVSAQSAASSSGSDADYNADTDLSLPPDVHSRLVHLVPGSSTEDFRPAVTFWEVLSKVKTRYVDKITDQDHLTHGAVSSMLRALRDPYSRVITPDELKLDQEESTGAFHGIGLVLGARLSGPQAPVQDIAASSSTETGPPRREAPSPDRAWQLVVVDTVPGGPASQAGVLTGDVVTQINGQRIERQPLASKTIDDLNAMLNGPDCHEATLSLVHMLSGKAVDVTIAHVQDSRMHGVEARMLGRDTVYARISLFTSTTSEELAHALSTLTASHPGSLLLDLRDNPGGSLSAGEAVVGMLAPGGQAGILDTHAGTQKLPAASDHKFPFVHEAILVDGGTANVAEMVAGALHERANARLLGASTFGNGLVQTTFPMAQGWAFSLTTGLLRTPQGVDFNQHGLAVDKPMSPDILQGDAAITAALPMLVAINSQLPSVKSVAVSHSGQNTVTRMAAAHRP
jgi:carboxyl-terminal processing protease